jgi:hypothetical protein
MVPIPIGIVSPYLSHCVTAFTIGYVTTTDALRKLWQPTDSFTTLSHFYRKKCANPRNTIPENIIGHAGSDTEEPPPQR